MSHVRSITAEDLADNYPVPLDLLGRITRANSEILLGLLEAIPECQRARLAVWTLRA